MPQKKSRVKNKYNQLTVIKEIEKLVVNGHGYRQFLCRCDCGNEKIVTLGKLKRGNTKSCGCLYKARMKEINKTHGMGGTTLYKKWKSMRMRVTNPNNKYYRHYGGRGIKICKRWDRFENFYKDMSISFNEHLMRFGTKDTTLERMNVDGDYKPSNCTWATRKEQANNTRRNKKKTLLTNE